MLSFFTILGLMTGLLNAVTLRRSDDATDNGYNATLRAAAEGTTITLVQGVWSFFYFGDAYTQAPPAFYINTNLTDDGEIVITDLFCKGDMYFSISKTPSEGATFLQLTNQPDAVTCNQTTTDPETAMSNGWAHSSLPLKYAGETFIQIWTWDSPFAGGSGAIQWRRYNKRG